MTYPLSTWLALGDSYTIGEGVDPAERWPTQLATLINSTPPEYVAKTGWTTVDLLKVIDQTVFRDEYDWISVLIGVNDQYDGLGIEAYRQGLTKIVEFAIRRVLHPQRVLMVSIPDYSAAPAVKDKDPDQIALEIGRFNAVAKEIATTESATFCDITQLSRLAADDLAFLVEDQLHPSGKMYALWAEQIAQEVTR